ncbi:methyltransferase domain-containing protein [Catellatospora citrea]|uniref:class I SAM-dependent methyltransferase n=1 Tax=Catellatospora citrea TaxID=53366 RepID=UPI0033EAD14B
MDDFYQAFAAGIVKSSGVMNCVQHLYVAQRCAPGARVVDVCCGRGLQVPLLYHHASHIGMYVGLDISEDNLREATQRDLALRDLHGEKFPTGYVQCDVSQPWPVAALAADVIVYTAALEHLPRAQGVASLRHAADALAAGGVLYLSTPITPGPDPKLLQYGVHVYEWDDLELREVLADCGLEIVEEIGLLPPAADSVVAGLDQRFGPGAGAWWNRLRALVPAAMLDVVTAAALPDLAAEVMFVCRRRHP